MSFHALPGLNLLHRRFGVDDAGLPLPEPFATTVTVRSRFQSVDHLRSFYRDRDGYTEIPRGVRFTHVIDRSEFGTIVEEYTL